MTKIKFVVLVCISLCCITVSAQSKADNVRRLLTLTGSAQIGVQVSANMMRSFKAAYTNVPAEFWDEFQKEIKAEELINLLIPVYEKYYTENEIVQLIQFYNSDLGKKVIQVSPQISQDSYSIGEAWGKAVAEKVITHLKEKGYFKED